MLRERSSLGLSLSLIADLILAYLSPLRILFFILLRPPRSPSFPHTRFFRFQLKPEPIRRLNLDLNINDNIGQANLVGTLYNPKKSLGLQTEPNLQIGGTLNFEEIQKPELNLIVNGYDIYFAKLENLNLNGVTDLTVSIIGKNVLDLQGSLKIKKSNGFLVPLADTEFETKHRIRNIDEEK